MGNKKISKIMYAIVAGTVGGALVGLGIKKMTNHSVHYDKDGYDAEGYNSEGFDRKGFDHSGFSKVGYDREGYDREGYDREGYDRNGFDLRGYDKNGYDKDGFDRLRRDKEGYSRSGFDRDGYNREGLDRLGYGRDGYNCFGIDRAGCTKQFYASYIEELHGRLDIASKQMKRKEYSYAVYDARVVMETALKLIVQHIRGKIGVGEKILANLKICEKEKIFDVEFLNRLHSARGIGNFNGHEFKASKELTHNKVYFVIMQVRELLAETEKLLVR